MYVTLDSFDIHLFRSIIYNQSFSKNGHDTMEAIDGDMTRLMGQRESLSFYDIKTANLLYQCAGELTRIIYRHFVIVLNLSESLNVLLFYTGKS